MDRTREGKSDDQGAFLGICLKVGSFLVIALILLIPGIPKGVQLLAMGGVLAGLVLAVIVWEVKHFGKNRDSIHSSLMNTLSRIRPDQWLVTRKFVVAKKSDVYIVLPRNSFKLYCIKFHRPRGRSSTETREPKLPSLVSISPVTLLRKTMSLPYQVKKIDDVRVARMEGTFRIPVAALQTGSSRYAVKWVEGPGLLYLIGRYAIGSGFAGRNVDVLGSINQHTLLKIIDELSADSPDTALSRGEEPGPLEKRIPIGKRLPVCGVCKSGIDPSEEVICCPHCGTKAHRLHMLEWIHVKGICPVCSKSLNEEEIARQAPQSGTRRVSARGGAE